MTGMSNSRGLVRQNLTVMTAWLINEAIFGTAGTTGGNSPQSSPAQSLKNVIRGKLSIDQIPTESYNFPQGKHLASACYVLQIDETIGPWLEVKMKKWTDTVNSATPAEETAALDALYQTRFVCRFPENGASDIL